MNSDNFLPIIGLEVHVELKTKSKMFCGCQAGHFGKEPNTQVCPVCLGLPGALPVPNKRAVEWCIMIGLALNCQIPEVSKFDRKNYFYPDLPKGYQISQYDMPLCVNGRLGEIRIRRVHMEEDTAKLIHQVGTKNENYTLIDFNRSGVPLVEIVTEPDIESAEEAKIFLKKLQQIIRYLGISDCDMEKGSMRLEPNISVRKLKTTTKKSKIDEELPDYKVEVKNINSFKFVERAIDYEIKRQIELLKTGEIPKQETRGWNEKKGATLPQRGKEEAQDYRYFPEPDIPPMSFAQSQISNLKSQIPELPDAKLLRFVKDYGLGDYDAGILMETRCVADYFEKALKHLGGGKLSLRSSDSPDGGWSKITPKIIANWIINKRVDVSKTSPEDLVRMIAQKSQVATMSDEDLGETIDSVLAVNPKAVGDYKSGRTQALMFLVGEVMRQTKGQVQAEKVKEKILSLL